VVRDDKAERIIPRLTVLFSKWISKGGSMDQRRISSLGAGIILILLGGWFLAGKLIPALEAFQIERFTWPLIIILIGAIMLILGLLTGSPHMAVPAFVISGIGGILYWQDSIGAWDSWTYIWTLIPGFVGLGTVVHGLLGGSVRRRVLRGLRSILISALLFLIFGSFFGGLTILGPYWPLLVVGVGVYMLVRALIPRSA
jgi:hypothetical protein